MKTIKFNRLVLLIRVFVLLIFNISLYKALNIRGFFNESEFDLMSLLFVILWIVISVYAFVVWVREVVDIILLDDGMVFKNIISNKTIFAKNKELIRYRSEKYINGLIDPSKYQMKFNKVVIYSSSKVIINLKPINYFRLSKIIEILNQEGYQPMS